jgi:hypothetical protein
MTSTIKTIVKPLAAIAAAAMIALPIAANAAVPGQSQLQGTITAINGKYDLHVEQSNGTVDNVMMHQGTIINPTGLTLQPGMKVTIVGDQQGDTFAANEIDTPYHYVVDVPVYPYGWGWDGGWGWGWGPGWNRWW